jgi:AcrR family transcriptional regulator
VDTRDPVTADESDEPEAEPEPEAGAEAGAGAGAGADGLEDTGRLYGGRTADERRRSRRRALLDAAYELYGTAGYRNVPIKQVCAHAHLTGRHLYEEFGSSEALLRAIYDRTVRRAFDVVVADVAAAGEEVRPRAEAAISAFVHALLDDPRAARIVCIEVVGVSDELERHRRWVLRTFADLLADEARRLGLTGRVPLRPDPRPTALSLVGGVYEVIVDWLQSDDRLPLDVVIQDLADLWAAAGAGPPERRSAP